MEQEVKIDNPPAFPSHNNMAYNEGLSLRDYFAAKTLGAIINTRNIEVDQPKNDHDKYWRDRDFFEIASCAYDFADAMLKARNL